jgi:hypothetical protein
MSLTEVHPRRRSRRWLRRVDLDLVRSIAPDLPVSERVDQLTDLPIKSTLPARFEAGLILSDPVERVATPTAATPLVRSRERVLASDVPEHWRCGIVLGPGGTVALDDVDVERAIKRPLIDLKPERRPRGGSPRRIARRRKLSLAERLLLVLQPPFELLLEPAGGIDMAERAVPVSGGWRTRADRTRRPAAR